MQLSPLTPPLPARSARHNVEVSQKYGQQQIYFAPTYLRASQVLGSSLIPDLCLMLKDKTKLLLQGHKQRKWGGEEAKPASYSTLLTRKVRYFIVFGYFFIVLIPS